MMIIDFEIDQLWSEQEALGFQVRIPWGTSHLHWKQFRGCEITPDLLPAQGFLYSEEIIELHRFIQRQRSCQVFSQSTYILQGISFQKAWTLFAKAVHSLIAAVASAVPLYSRPYHLKESYFSNQKKRLSFWLPVCIIEGAGVLEDIGDYQTGGEGVH